ncbi:MAG: 50S ribosomal protein L21 [Gammaproteobacteria bacterium]
MYAVIASGGKQYPVSPGEVVRLERLAAAQGEAVEFDRVALISDDEGKISVGAPWIEGGRVRGEVTAQGRGEKVTVVKFKRRKNYRRKHGHRQAYTEVKISEIVTG